MNYFTYILASESGTLYVGVTNNLVRRVDQHKSGLWRGFASKYGCNKLVYSEKYSDVNVAIGREKQIKKFSRQKKTELIQLINPQWKDVSVGW
ncbi:MAG: GIY-YIG nuclease family protein [Candidatus Falkowbacteria bacterium]